MYIQAGTILKPNSTLDPTDSLEVFDFQTKRWTRLYDQNNPKKRTGHTYVRFKNKIFIYGGTTGSRIYLNDLVEFDLETSTFSDSNNTFKQIPDRFGHSSGLIDDTMIVFGGMFFSFLTYSWVYYNDFHAINLVTKKHNKLILHKESDSIEPVGAHSAIENERQNEIFIFGGLNGRIRNNLLYSLKIKDGKYILKNLQPTGDVPCGRAGSALSILDNQIFMTGGYNGEHALDDVYKYDILSNMWIKLKVDLPHGLRLHSMNLRKFDEGYSLVIFGGMGRDENERHNEILELVIESNRFMKELLRNTFYMDVEIFFKT